MANAITISRQLITVAVSSALVAPCAFAAQDGLGMNYTSAAEGFYGSLRAVWESNAGAKGSGAGFNGAASRLGVQGANDLGGGLRGYYRVEFDVGDDDGDAVENRLRVVGLRGGFGELEVGSFWDDQYNFVTGLTDFSPDHSARYAPNLLVGSSLQYRTPVIGGFQGSVRVGMTSDTDDADHADYNPADDDYTDDDDSTGTIRRAGNGDVVISGGLGDGNAAEDDKDENHLDQWSLSAKYAYQGFIFAANYQHTADYLPRVEADAFGDSDNAGATEGIDDHVFWAVGLGYAQDNWSVGGWYGENEARVATTATANRAAKIVDTEEEIVSVAARVDIDKITVYGVYEQIDNAAGLDGVERVGGNVGVLYRLGANTNAWIEYVGNDDDIGAAVAGQAVTVADSKDRIVIGLRHNF